MLDIRIITILKDRKRDKKLEFHSIEKWSDYGEVERFNIPASIHLIFGFVSYIGGFWHIFLYRS